MQLLHVFIRNDAAAGEQHILHPFFIHQLFDAREYRHVGAAENAHANGIHVFLQGCIHHHIRGLAQAGVNHFHAGVAQGGGNHLGATVVAVQSNFGYQYTYGSVHMAYLLVGAKVSEGYAKFDDLY